MGILRLKKLFRNIAGRKGGAGGSSALDRDFRRITRQIPLEDKRDLILQYGDEASKRRAHSIAADGKAAEGGEKSRSPQEFAEEVAFWTDDFPQPAAVVPLREALERGNSRWIDAFRDADGISSLCMVLEALAESRDMHLEEGDSINPQQVPPDEVRVEEEVVECLMAIFNKEGTGLSTLQEGNANLWPVIVRSAVDSTSDLVRSSLLKVLTVMLETRRDGLKVVLGALDVAKAQKNKDGRFSILAFEFEERVFLRGEMVEAGMVEAVVKGRSGMRAAALLLEATSDDEDGGDGGEAGRPAIGGRGAGSSGKKRGGLGGGGGSGADGALLFLSGSSEGSSIASGSSKTIETSTPRSSFYSSGSSSAVGMGTVAADARLQLRLDLMAQARTDLFFFSLDLFDRVADEDMRDAEENGGGDGGEGEGAPLEGEGGDDKAGLSSTGGGGRGAETERQRRRLVFCGRVLALASCPQVEAHHRCCASFRQGRERRGCPGSGPACRRPRPFFVSSPKTKRAGNGNLRFQPAPRCAVVANHLVGACVMTNLPYPPFFRDAASAAVEQGSKSAGGTSNSDDDGGKPRPPPSTAPAATVPSGPIPPPPPLPPSASPLALATASPLPVAKPAGPARRGVPWKVIKAAIGGTVFEEILAAREEVEVPKKMILEGFQEKPKGAKTGKKEPLLGAAALQYEIVFSTVSVSPETLRTAVMSMDLSFLTQDTLAKLNTLQPQPQELAILRAVKVEDVAELPKVEQFLVLASRIPNYHTRLRCAGDMQSFQPDTDTTLAKIATVSEAVSEVTSSAKLKRLLAVVLAVGNFLNEGTGRGGAKAITLDSLLKLPTVRRTNKRALAGQGDDNLAHMIMEWAEKAEPSLLSLGEDLPLAAEASKLGLDDLKKEVLVISKNIGVLAAKLKEAKEKRQQQEGKQEADQGGDGGAEQDEDKFVEVVEPFLASSKVGAADVAPSLHLPLSVLSTVTASLAHPTSPSLPSPSTFLFFLLPDSNDRATPIQFATPQAPLEHLRAEHSRVEEAYRSMATKFGEDPKKTPNEQFFDIVKNVVLMVETATRQNRERAEAEEARIRREKRASKRKRERELAKASAQRSEVNLQSLLVTGAGRMRQMVKGTSMVNEEFDRILEERAKESETFQQISETTDGTVREQLRGQLHYQKSTSQFGSGGVGFQRSQRGGPSSILVSPPQPSRPSSSVLLNLSPLPEKDSGRGGGDGGSATGGGGSAGDSGSVANNADSNKSSGSGTDGVPRQRHERLGREASLAKHASVVRKNTALHQARSFARTASTTGAGTRTAVAGTTAAAAAAGTAGTAAVKSDSRPSLASPPVGVGRSTITDTPSGLVRSRGRLQVPPDDGSSSGGFSDGSQSPKISRGALSKRLVDTRGKKLDTRRRAHFG
ncbi:unnamed protein product [Scytosiphon promiscuus]